MTGWVRNVCSNTWSAAAKRGLRIAAQQMVIQRDIGAAPALEMLKIRKSRRRLQFRMNENRRGGRFDLVIDAGVPRIRP